MRIEDCKTDSNLKLHPRCRGGGPFFGRILLSLIFLLAGLGKIANFNLYVDMLQQAGVVGGASFYVAIALILEIVGSLMIIFGLYTRIGCWLLMIFLVPVTFVFHSFWIYQGQEQMLQSAMFFKNVAIFGGLLLLKSYGPGRWSLDARICMAKHSNLKQAASLESCCNPGSKPL